MLPKRFQTIDNFSSYAWKSFVHGIFYRTVPLIRIINPLHSELFFFF